MSVIVNIVFQIDAGACIFDVVSGVLLVRLQIHHGDFLRRRGRASFHIVETTFRYLNDILISRNKVENRRMCVS